MSQEKKIFHENTHLICTPEAAKGAFQSVVYQKHLVDIQSKYQKIDVYQTEVAGKILVLDGIIQLTELDEFIYHEMLVHVPMFSHFEPKSVLIIGGGDGCSLREVLKHQSVQDVCLVDIDAEIIEIGRKYFGNSESFDDPRVQVVIDDAAVFIKNMVGKYDVIIIDITDASTNGGASIYSRHFATSVCKHLHKNGVASLIAGVPMAQGLGHVKEFNKIMSFSGYKPHLYTTTVPSYYGGLTAMFAYGELSLDRCIDDFGFNHYSLPVHAAAFALPKWLKDMWHGE